MIAYLSVFVSEALSTDDLGSIVAAGMGSSPVRVECFGPYWKIPKWDEYLVQVDVGEEEQLAVIADSLGSGWIELNGQYFWKVEDGGSFTIPFATWAHLELKS